jgi:nitrous oxide reductase accessory protein NosL
MRKSALAVTILSLALAACSSDKGGDCPTMTGVTDASVRTVFRPGTTQDPANVLYIAEITRVAGGCDIDKKTHATDAKVTVHFRAAGRFNILSRTSSLLPRARAFWRGRPLPSRFRSRPDKRLRR